MKYSKRDFEVILKENGYKLCRTKGGHLTYKAEGNPRIITINKKMNKMIAQRLIKENNLTIKED